MKKILVLLAALVLSLSLASCKKKNDAKNLEIYKKDNQTYTLRYCATNLAFGDLFITIEDEKLVDFYCTYDKDSYRLKEYQLMIGTYSSALTLEDSDGKVIFTPKNAFSFTNGKDDDGYEILNTFDISIYVSFEDVHTDEDDYSKTLKDDSGITVETSPEALLVFIRNKAIEKNPSA